MTKIGLDLDGVIYNIQTTMDWFFLEQKGVPKLDVRFYDYQGRYGISNEKGEEYLNEFGKADPFLWVRPFQDNLNSIRKIVNDDLYIITKRNWHPKGFEQTKYRLDKDGIIVPQKNIILSGEKGIVSKVLELDVFYEDCLLNAIDIINNSNAKVYLINRPWNTNFEAPEEIIRVNNIEETL